MNIIDTTTWNQYEAAYGESALAVPQALRQLESTLAVGSDDEIDMILYSDLLEHVRYGGDVFSIVEPVMKVFQNIATDQRAAEKILGFLFYVFSLHIRTRVPILTLPSFFRLNQRRQTCHHFAQFVVTAEKLIPYCSSSWKIYFSTSINPSRKSVKLILSELDAHKTEVEVLKNAAVALGIIAYVSKSQLCDWEFVSSTIGEKLYSNILCGLSGKKIDEAVILNNLADDEDTDLIWAQSFVSVAAYDALLCSEICKENIDAVIRKINTMKALPAERGFEFEFDGYKILNEDLAAIVFSEFLGRGPTKNSALNCVQRYCLDRLSENNLQSHSLLFAGLLIDSERGRDPVTVYGYKI